MSQGVPSERPFLFLSVFRAARWELGLLAAAHLGLLAVFDLASRPLLTLGLMALAFTGLGLSARKLEGAALTTVQILAVAAVLRALLLPVPPTLSNDVLRYVWDGRVLIAGHDPYALAPEAPALEPLRDDLWQRMHHHEVPTVYPPLALGVFAVAASLPVSPALQIFGLKLLLVLADLAACAALVYLARQRNLPTSRILWYAWNPLVVLEVAGMGHVDALGVLMVVLALTALSRRPFWAAAAAAGGVLAKLVPLILWPLLGLRSRHVLGFWAVALLVTAAGLLPVLLAAGGIPPGLATYSVSWEFNGPLYEPLWRGLETAGSPAFVERALDTAKAGSANHAFWNSFYPLNYPQLHAKLLLLGLLGLLALKALFQRDVAAATGATLGAVLICSATVYPWYALWVLPWAALLRQPAWLALSVLLPLSYLPQVTEVEYFPWVYLAIWLPFALLFLRFPRWSTA